MRAAFRTLRRTGTQAWRATVSAGEQLFARVLPSRHAAFRTRRDYADHEERRARYDLVAPRSAQARSIVEDLRRHGYHVIRGYWDRAKCEIARAEVDRLLKEHPEFIHPGGKSDQRLFGADALSPLIAEFGNDPVFGEAATLHNRMPTRLGMTLAARLPASPNNLGSGEGWHRDQFFGATKAMLYLTDVSAENGPFQLVDRSWDLEDVCRDIVDGGLAHMQYRVSQEQVGRLLAAAPERLKTFDAPAGTVLLFNTSAIHRGKPIEAGIRYALTNYYFTAEWSDEEIHAQFAPVATAPAQ